MCLIIYSPSGYIPGKHLSKGLQANPDGWGYMFADNGKIIIRKGMKPRHFWAQWRQDKLGGGIPVVWHARIGTHGHRAEFNCHPFEIPKHGLAMAHNGIIAQHSEANNPLSDTQLFLQQIICKLPKGFLKDLTLVKLVGYYIGHSKLAFMDELGEVTIINEHLGNWSKYGRWYSNDSWKPGKPVFLPFINAIKEINHYRPPAQ